MKAKINAGADIDFLTKDELTEALAAWMGEVARGITFRQFSARTDVVGGVWTIGGNQADNRSNILGPAEGFKWSITRMYVSGTGVVPGTDLFSVYIDELSSSKLVVSGLTRGKEWDPAVFPLQGGEKIALSGVGTGATGTEVTVSGAAIELPNQLAWQLL